MLDPWIIEQIKRQEEEKRRREEEQRREQPSVPADDPREIPDPRDDRGRTPDPGYEMPSPGDPKRDERPKDKEESGRGVTTIDIGGGSSDEEEDPNTIDISKIPAGKPEDEGEKRPE